MSAITRWFRIMLVATAMAAPLPAHAQSADDLHERAVALHVKPSRYTTAAALHIREARIRGYDDAQSTECLYVAANLLYFAGKKSQALTTMVDAAESSTRRGDVMRAANAFISAAFIAKDLKNPVVRELVQRARVLAEAPGLTDAQRVSITSRLPLTPAVATRNP
jgi:hypothetical protein